MNRRIAPKYYQPNKLDLRFPKRIELQNGVELFWFDEVKDNAVRLDIEWNAGSSLQKKPLSASFTNKLLLSGTPSKTATQIAEELDFFGGFVNQEIDKDQASLSLFGLSENLPELWSILSDAVNNCDFPDAEIEKDRRIKIDKFKINLQKVKTLCHREFNKNIFGENSAYGKLADLTDFEQLKRSEIIEFFNTQYTQKPVIFLTGKVDEKIIGDLDVWSSKFTEKAESKAVFEFSQTKGRINIDKIGALQSAIRIGRLFVNKKHPDYFGFQILNTLFGGYFGSRLMSNIREDKGYTYGIGSGVAVLQKASYFFISTEVGAEFKEATIAEIYKEMERLKDELVDEKELDRVKNYVLGEFLRQADGPMAMMENFKNIYFNDLGENYYSDFIQAIHALKPKDIADLANKYLNRDEMLEVVAG